MQPLDRQLRNKLESTVKEARDVAEAAASAAVEQIGVGAKAAYSHLSDQEKDLRRRLRIHGKQLGDHRDSKSTNPTVGEQEIDCLVEEVAYEHWHRMLFARFLAENNLLMYPDETDPVPVTLGECEDLASDEDAANGWELASRFAAKMLPQIFRTDSPVFELALPPEHQQKLERLLADLPKEVFHASDALGWVYQFWQAKRKDEVNASEVKIGARELPAVTQLFTEPYMVAFLLDNTLGAWWAGKRLSEADLANAKSEDELRQKASLPGLPLEYLRFVQGEDGKGGPWRPAAGTFDGWPDQTSELKVLDPCCGSGHFLVAALHMLVPMRMEMDGLSEQEAVDAVLSENLHGLEIDKRCTEIAAFALAHAAWTRTGYRHLPELQIACTGLAPQASKSEWLGLAEKAAARGNMPVARDLYRKEESLLSSTISNALESLYDLFAQAPTLGSLINPAGLSENVLQAGYGSVAPLMTEVLKAEVSDVEARERAIAAAGMVKAADLLAGNYTLVITNVPYLGRKAQDDLLKKWADENEQDARKDLATIFLSRSLGWLGSDGTLAIVNPQNWLFLTTYRHLRERLLKRRAWNCLARLGPGAFEMIGGHVVNVALLVLSGGKPNDNSHMAGIDATGPSLPCDKARSLAQVKVGMTPQAELLENPDCVIALESIGGNALLRDVAFCPRGIVSGDNARWYRTFLEVEAVRPPFSFIQVQPSTIRDFHGLHQICDFSHPDEFTAWSQRNPAWGKAGVAVNRASGLATSIYLGCDYDQGLAPVVPTQQRNAPAVFSFANSQGFRDEVRKLDSKVSVTPATFLKVPFDLAHWQEVAAKKYPDGLPEPESNDPTQWLFHGRPDESTDPLQVAVARLLGYRWPAELDEDIRLSDRARELVKRCDELLPLADKDGIVCIPPVRGEASAADRLHNLLAKAYGDAWSTDKLNELLKQAAHGGKTLESWLRDKFFAQHCQVFGQRPFIWHIWDGLQDGFSALVNYHKLDHKNLETLIYTYLGDWISRQKRDRSNNVDGAEERLDAAEALKKRLELILKGEAPYDIFVRWKPLHEQPIGWEPDLNDGVRLNIRPFMSVSDVKKKGAGVLREKPKVKWTKDRGKEPKRDKDEYPWFWGWDEKTTDFTGGKKFDGNRWNDCHYSIAVKKAARDAKAGEE